MKWEKLKSAFRRLSAQRVYLCNKLPEGSQEDAEFLQTGLFGQTETNVEIYTRVLTHTKSCNRVNH